MLDIIIAVALLTVVGFLCSVMLVIASNLFKVETNPKTDLVRVCLPGANCGACGYAGCDGYAHALAEGIEENVGLCTPGAAKVAADVAEVLGVTAAEVTRKVALVSCNGTCDKTESRADFAGSKSCASAKLIYGGGGKCIYGCIGLGDCVTVCEYDAIHVVDGVAKVDVNSCTACGRCAKKCPNGLISIIPADKPVAVKCSNTDKGAVAMKNCKAACIGCMKCTKVCPNEAITVENNLARIDYSKCIACGACADACPTGAIKFKK